MYRASRTVFSEARVYKNCFIHITHKDFPVNRGKEHAKKHNGSSSCKAQCIMFFHRLIHKVFDVLDTKTGKNDQTAVI